MKTAIKNGWYKTKLGIKTSFILGLVFVSVLIAVTVPHDGPSIWFEFRTPDSSSGVATFNLRTQSTTTIVSFKQTDSWLLPSLSPDGQRIAFQKLDSTRRYAIWVVSADGSDNLQIGDAHVRVNSFWRDADHLLLMGSDELRGGQFAGDVKEYEFSTASLRAIDAKDITLYCITGLVSRQNALTAIANLNGTMLGYGHLGNENGGLAKRTDQLFDLTGVLKDGADCLSLSSDRKKIAFVGLRGNISDLYFSVDGANSWTQLTNFGKNYKESAISPMEISPDGMQIVMLNDLGGASSGAYPEGRQLILLKTDGSETKFLGEWGQTSDEYLLWSPDSRFIATSFVSWSLRGYYGGISLIDAESGEYESLLPDGNAKRVFDFR